MGCGTSFHGGEVKKSERAMKAAILIQRWFRCYMARLEVRRLSALNIFQSIEYADEQAQLQLSDFFSFLLEHFTDFNKKESELMCRLFSASRICDPDSPGDKLKEYERMIEVPPSYLGPRLSFPLTIVDINAILQAFKHRQLLHARYVLQLLHETKKVLKQMPNITHLSTSYFKEITVCGDLHGKLDDLLLIFYKNGLPSGENPYIFNGDFVDRGKHSMEILIILFAFLLVYPNDLHLNRGNHEDFMMNMRYGFTKEVMQKYKHHGGQILQLLEDVYSWLPLATVIDHKILIVHGGISDTTDLELLSCFERSLVKSVLVPPMPVKTEKAQFQSYSTTQGVASGFDRVTWVPYRNATLIDRCDRSGELSRKEWKQVVDILWSDPRSRQGCSPNTGRGGGCYFGPDVTTKLFAKYGLKMIIRSHECKPEGYDICHNGRVVTVFSASNYYEEGSNRGAYLKLNPDMSPRFVQYQVSKTTHKKTFNQRVSLVESTALRALRERLIGHRSELVAAFRRFDPGDTGKISVPDWVSVMESVLNLPVPWRSLCTHLASLDPEGRVDYLSCFSHLQVQEPVLEAHSALVETLYRYRSDLEIVFNIIDKDHSGLISMEEFRQMWQLFNAHHHVNVDDTTIDHLAQSMDLNKDGSIDFNEFLKAFHVVHRHDPRWSTREGTPPPAAEDEAW
ncbi:serine/threonine-protein phosphatase with EF-hands 1 [Ornithorhynchus anatinus]|uniref:serine/threonine-protein phosphatase with EF-hands 1 n=1 Tax=Ornithorhynchus anatinus TaxID=9258 RepID=UPI0019D49EEC|nr:serine/threonine-protein phosphatase with EF-hands 1 [Ornithorhynchus anatinus]